MPTKPPPYDWITSDDGAHLLARGTTPDEIRATVQRAIANGNDGCEPWPLLDTNADHWRIDTNADLTPSWYRKNPCHPNNCWEPNGNSPAHGWHLGTGREGQPGAFLAATVAIVADEPDEPAEDPDEPTAELPDPLFPHPTPTA